MKKFSLFLILFLLAGCATAKSHTWEGRSERELFAIWGQPDKTSQVDSKKKILTYNTFSYVYFPDSNPADETSYIGNTAHFAPSYNVSPSQNKGNHCKSNFVIENDRITSWKYEGNGCQES